MDDVGMSRNVFVKIGGRGNDIQMAFDHADGRGQNVDSLVDRSIIFNVKRMPSIKCIDRTVCVCVLFNRFRCQSTRVISTILLAFFQ
jgi:hypothetical protein